MQKEELSHDSLAKTIAGEIVLSENPGSEIQKWRNIFKIPQRQLADKMNVMPSVISDYESGRRKSPGVRFIQRIVNALLELDTTNGSTVINEFQSTYPKEVLSDAVLDMKDYGTPFLVSDFLRIVEGKLVVDTKDSEKTINGHIIVDSLKAVLELSTDDLVRLHGITTKKAMIFTNIRSGKSAFIAIKVTGLKPCVVIFHGIPEVDPLAIRIAKAENIPVIVSKIKNIDELINVLKTKINKESAETG